MPRRFRYGNRYRNRAPPQRLRLSIASVRSLPRKGGICDIYRADDYIHPLPNHQVLPYQSRVDIYVAARCRVDVYGKGLGCASWLPAEDSFQEIGAHSNRGACGRFKFRGRGRLEVLSVEVSKRCSFFKNHATPFYPCLFGQMALLRW